MESLDWKLFEAEHLNCFAALFQCVRYAHVDSLVFAEAQLFDSLDSSDTLGSELICFRSHLRLGVDAVVVVGEL